MKTSAALTLLLILGIIKNVSLFPTKKKHFEDHIEAPCYDQLHNKELLYGQEYPLAQTLDNFLNLVEKYELANTDKTLKDVTGMLLKYFTFENVIKDESGFADGNVKSAKISDIEKYWDKKLSEVDVYEQDPFTDDEMCSLFFMLTHSVNDTAWPEEKLYSAQASGSDGLMRDVVKTEHPREQGVVAIEMGSRSVALGRVVAGIYLGSFDSQDRLEDLTSYDLGGQPVKDAVVDPLYTLTISDFLALASWNEQNPKELGGNGEWYSYQDTKIFFPSKAEICPNVYRLPEKRDTSMYTYSSLRGAIDGIILGNLLRENKDLRNKKLSQLLRMYYSGDGIKISHPKEEEITFCKRSELIQEHKDNIIKETEHAIYILSDSVKKIPAKLETIRNTYDSRVLIDDVINVKGQDEVYDICETDHSTASIESLPCETPSDVIAVLDTRNGEEFMLKQRTILGYLANNLKLWHQGSKLTVLLDRRNGTNGLSLEEFLLNSISSSCAACSLLHKEIDSSSSSETKDIIIQSVDKFLQDKKSEEKDLNGAPGKVLIYFDFDTSETPSYRLKKVLEHFFLGHLDTTIYAIGNEKEVLAKYARNNIENSLLASADIKELVNDLTQKICKRPAALKYEDCIFAKNERSAIFDGLVTLNSIQHWSMDPEYFEKSYNAKLVIELEDKSGEIEVFHNRANSPETSEKNHKQLNSSVPKLIYEHAHPCKGFSSVTCSPMMFSFVGREKKNKNDNGATETNTLCEDKEGSNCKRLDQIRFKISHDGIRCSGCSGLSSTFMIMIISILISFIMS